MKTNATMVNDGQCPACNAAMPAGSRCYVFLNALGRIVTVCSNLCKGIK